MILIIALFFFGWGSGLVVKGNDWTSNKNWNLIAKFCFESGGKLEATLMSKSTSGYINSYTDVGVSWDAFSQDQSCPEKLDHSIQSKYFREGHELKYETQHNSLRDRWWFFTVSNCTHVPVSLDRYELKFLNPGGIFRRHFSANEYGIAEMVIVFWILSLFLSVWSAYLSRFSFLPVGQYKLMRSIACVCSIQTIGLFLEMIHVLKFAHDGLGVSAFKTISIFIVILTHTMLLYVGLMVSRGWGVSDAVNLGYAPAIGVFSFLVFLFELLVWVYYIKVIDPSDVRDPIHTWPGYCLCIIQCCAFAYLCWQVFRHTIPLLTTRDARFFYMKFLVIFGAWIFSLPLTTFITCFISDHFRTKVVFGIEFCLLICFCAALVWLFRNEFEWRYSVDQLLQSPLPNDVSKFNSIELSEGIQAPPPQEDVSEEDEQLGSP